MVKWMMSEEHFKQYIDNDYEIKYPDETDYIEDIIVENYESKHRQQEGYFSLKIIVEDEYYIIEDISGSSSFAANMEFWECNEDD